MCLYCVLFVKNANKSDNIYCIDLLYLVSTFLREITKRHLICINSSTLHNKTITKRNQLSSSAAMLHSTKRVNEKLPRT